MELKWNPNGIKSLIFEMLWIMNKRTKLNTSGFHLHKTFYPNAFMSPLPMRVCVLTLRLNGLNHLSITDNRHVQDY